MQCSFFNGQYLPHDEIRISPDERGFLFADGIYEVVRWYGGFFYDMEGHVNRLKRSLKETGIVCDCADDLPHIAAELVQRNELGGCCANVYIQITRGAAKRSHSFPVPPVTPTVYATATRLKANTLSYENGISTSLMPDIRWSRCDIKSIALLPNILAYQKSLDDGNMEAIFVRDGVITEASHANVFFVRDETVYTHPESAFILSGITRRNIIRIAINNNIPLEEEAVTADMLPYLQEAFLANTSGEITPVIKIGDLTIGEGVPGQVTKRLQRLFSEEITERAKNSSL